MSVTSTYYLEVHVAHTHTFMEGGMERGSIRFIFNNHKSIYRRRWIYDMIYNGAIYYTNHVDNSLREILR